MRQEIEKLFIPFSLFLCEERNITLAYLYQYCYFCQWSCFSKSDFAHQNWF